MIHCNFQEFAGFSQVHWSWVWIVRILHSSQELWAKYVKSGRFAGISESSLPMVRNLKALMYSGSINGVNFTSFMGFRGELCEICIIRWKFCQKIKLKFESFAHKRRRNKCVQLSRTIFLAKRFRLFAMRLPSLSRGK